MSLNKIKLFKLKKINIKNGKVLRVLRKTDKKFYKFSECYFSFVSYKKIKAWKKHKKMKMNLIVPVGKVKFIFYCEKIKKFKKIIIGENNYQRLFVPGGLWFGFQGLSKVNLILNISNIIHNEKEVLRKEKSFLKFI
jgi:dTDP-4-dehydrorhamnose 3,5-epimerase